MITKTKLSFAFLVSVLGFASSIQCMQEENQQSASGKGTFIAFVGVPGVGKSTLATALAEALEAEVFIEPGEKNWPVPAASWQEHVAVLERWVCETNNDNFEQARKLADAGKVVVADTALFLINREMVNAPCCSWYYGLMSQAEKDAAYQRAESYWKHAPCPDILVLLEADLETWKSFLLARRRTMDADSAFIRDYAAMQALITNAAKQFASERGARFVTFCNQCDSIGANAERLRACLDEQFLELAIFKSKGSQ